ncbi:UNVERIFIED_CONTAM: hypothetical protein GTU68_011969, partial [Idotea baltica]|nr:hypothetical protein [Idotea baltica]
ATSGLASAGILLKTSKAEAASNKRVNLVTTWSPKMPILQDSAERLSRLVKEATAGKLRIKVYAGGELIPPLGVFDAVSSGDVQLGIGASYYWSGKIPATPFYTAIPFGFDTETMNSWLSSGGGLQLWEELYKPHNLVPISIGNTGAQMAGWFKKELKSPADLKGLKIRMPGLGGKVLAKAGANVVLLPGAELYTALERGTIDATEWVGPMLDERLGLHRAAEFCYYPGWQEPSTNIELIINDSVWKSWPIEYQGIVRACAAEVSSWAVSEFLSANGEALKRLKENDKIQIKKLPDSILAALKKSSDIVVEELASQDA